MKIDGHGYSSTILYRILHLAGVTSSFDVAEMALKVVGEITISDRQINKLISEVGVEMAADRDIRTRRYVEQPLPRQPTVAERRRIWRRCLAMAVGCGRGSPIGGRAFTSRTGARRRTRAFIGCKAAHSPKTRKENYLTVFAVKRMWKS